jgi:hypothetical protein
MIAQGAINMSGPPGLNFLMPTVLPADREDAAGSAAIVPTAPGCRGRFHAGLSHASINADGRGSGQFQTGRPASARAREGR